MCSNKERLDVLLFEKGLAVSRSKARVLILDGQVLVDSKPVLKPSSLVLESSNLEVLYNPSKNNFVSRGGDKLQGALESFNDSSSFPELKDIVALDLGASTGGFTECLLFFGASKVYSVDVGINQLHSSLKQNKKVVSLEKTNLKELDKSMFNPVPSFAVVDLSFTGLSKVLSFIPNLLTKDFHILALVKPQFELEKEQVSKNGTVKKPELEKEAIEKVKSKANELGLKVHGIHESVLKGQKKGNQEYFILLSLI